MRSIALNVDASERNDMNIAFLSTQNKEVALKLRGRYHIVGYYRIDGALKAKHTNRLIHKPPIRISTSRLPAAADTSAHLPSQIVLLRQPARNINRSQRQK